MSNTILVNEDYDNIKNLGLKEFKESLGNEMFWLDSICNLLGLESIDEAMEAVKRDQFDEEFYESEYTDHPLADEGLDAIYESSIDFPTCSYYIRLFTKTAFRDAFTKKLKETGYLEDTNLSFFLDNFYIKGGYPDNVVHINSKPIHTKEELDTQVDILLAKWRKVKRPVTSIFEELTI